MNGDWITPAIIVIVTMIVFFLIREVLTWYWKLNRIVELLEEQNSALKAIFEQLGGKISKKE